MLWSHRQSLSYCIYFSCITLPCSLLRKFFLQLFLSYCSFCVVFLAICYVSVFFEMEFSNDQWVQEQRDHSYHHKSVIGYMCMGQTALANVSRMCDPGRSSVNRRKHLQQFCLKSQINYITNRNELKRDLGTMCFLFTCLKYLGEKIKYLIIIFWCTAQ